MKELRRSDISEAVVKKKSSSGCLIIKKKVGDVGFNGSSSRSLFNSNPNPRKEKKRPRSDSESSDELPEPHHCKFDKFSAAKRTNNGFDVFDLDDHDGFSDRRFRKDVYDDRYRSKLYRHSGESGSGCNRMIVDERRECYRPRLGIKSQYDMEDVDTHLPLSVLSQKYLEASDEPIRLQGKNGVLKVMINKRKQMGNGQNEPRAGVLIRKRPNVFEPEEGNKRKTVSGSSLKPVASKNTEKMVKVGDTLSLKTENVISVRGKVKRGSGTEKQLLREKIRSLLLGAGWTIDYRPRRNRDYLDAVYINPSGTAYWSIVKAYEALQKEDKDKSKALPDEILSKLTRQTRKKIERELKKKRRDESDSRGAKRVKNRLSTSDISDDENPMKTNVRKTGKIGRCTLLVRGSDQGMNSNSDGFTPYLGKRTVLSWLIDSGTVRLSEKVEYMIRRKTRVLLEGWITRDGIHCGCCSKILTVSKFELHAGSKLRQPFPNTFTLAGQSLTQCQVDAWNKHGESERKGFHAVENSGDDPDDDTCGLCGDGGDLICCDGCPSTFHQSCLDIQLLPQGDWHCPNCSCKYCEIASINSTEASGRTESPLRMCCLCEKKYHESCKPIDPDDPTKPVDLDDPNLSFCGPKCQELYSHLHKLLGIKHELGSGFSWSLIHRSDLLSDTSSVEYSQRVECNSKLAVAMSVIDECFWPIVDRRSGVNLLRNVVYNCGSNFSRLNYSGFFTAILERGDEMISAASIRIHGTQLAEMPFIGTRHIYRRQGMCRRLLSAIETVLASLRIEKLIMPAIAEHMNTWTDVFGFKPLEKSHKREMRAVNILVFPGTDMLQKQLTPQGDYKASGEATPAMAISSKGKETFTLNALADSSDEIGVSVEQHLVKESGKDAIFENTHVNVEESTSKMEVIPVQNGTKTSTQPVIL